MASTITIRVDGLSELSRRMKALDADVTKKFAPRATGKAGSIVKKAAKAKLRVQSTDTGLLERAVIVKKIPKSQTDLTSEHIVTVKQARYPDKQGRRPAGTRRVGVFKEFGTVTQAAEPWLRPALENNLQPAINAMADSLERDITKAGG